MTGSFFCFLRASSVSGKRSDFSVSLDEATASDMMPSRYMAWLNSQCWFDCDEECGWACGTVCKSKSCGTRVRETEGDFLQRMDAKWNSERRKFVGFTAKLKFNIKISCHIAKTLMRMLYLLAVLSVLRFIIKTPHLDHSPLNTSKVPIVVDTQNSWF